MPREKDESFAIDADSLKTILAEVMGAVQQNQLTPDLIKAIAESTADAARKAVAPVEDPLISHFNPKGERLHPRDDLPGRHRPIRWSTPWRASVPST